MSIPRVGELISQRRKRDLSVHSYKRFARRVWQLTSHSAGRMKRKYISSANSRGRARGRAMNWDDNKIEAEMCFCLNVKNAGPYVEATGSGTWKRRDDARRKKIRAWRRNRRGSRRSRRRHR